MTDITNLDTNASLNAKINEVKGKVPNITNLDNATFTITNLDMLLILILLLLKIMLMI